MAAVSKRSVQLAGPTEDVQPYHGRGYICTVLSLASWVMLYSAVFNRIIGSSSAQATLFVPLKWHFKERLEAVTGATRTTSWLAPPPCCHRQPRHTNHVGGFRG